MDSPGFHRPRNVDWRRAAALLYGDWGTSKAYVIGLAFFAAGYASLPVIIAVCVLTALVGYNYIIVCRHFPDGGGVYSAARIQSRNLAAIGALLLVANFIVTAALSCNAAMAYFGVPPRLILLFTMTGIVIVGAVNWFGPKHTGSLAVSLAIPTVVVVVAIIAMSVPHLTTAYLEMPHVGFSKNWQQFVGVILALSGVEAIANLTGVMKLDPGATPERPAVAGTARKSIVPVAIEVVAGTVLLGWAMLSLAPELAPDPAAQRDYMIRYLGAQYGTLTFGPAFGAVFGIAVGIVVGLLLLSAVNTAIAAQIGLIYLLARDGEMPRPFRQLNQHGVPYWPWALATLLPVLTVVVTGADIETLAGLYAIGVVGAIAVNLGSCTFNSGLKLKWTERGLMALTTVVLLAAELTIAKTNPDALFFALCVLGAGMTLRGVAQRRAGLRTVTVSKEIADQVAPEQGAERPIELTPGQTIMVAVRGVTPVLKFALEEAKLRQGRLYVLFVKELGVTLLGTPLEDPRPRWQNDPGASEIMTRALAMGHQYQVQVFPIYTASEDPSTTILDLAATLGVDILMLGSAQRSRLVQLLKGDVVNRVARGLPENIQLVIHS